MGLTLHRRRVNQKKKEKRNRKLSMSVMCLGVFMLLFGEPNSGLLALMAGGQMFFKSRNILRTLKHPYSFRDTYPDYKRCNLDDFSENEFHDLFRFDKDAVKKILKFFVYFGNMPETVYVPYIAKNRVRHYIFGIEELFLMCLMYMCHPVRQLEVAIRFGRTVPEVSRGLTYFHGLLHPISQRFLQNENQNWFNIRVATKCARALRRKGCPLPNCLGFCDGTLRPVCNPGVPWLQTALYNGHKRVTGFQWMGTSLPNGMCLLLLGPTEGRRHDAACAAIHGLYEKLNVLGTFNGLAGTFGGDSAFPTFWPVVPNFAQAQTPNEATWNRRMSRVRISVEWLFHETLKQFASLDWKRRHKVLASPVDQWYLNCTFLMNLHNINYPNLSSQFFGVKPPSFEEYLGVPRGSLR